MTKKRKMPKRAQRTGPWDALGISSSTYYRRQRSMRESLDAADPPTFTDDPDLVEPETFVRTGEVWSKELGRPVKISDEEKRETAELAAGAIAALQDAADTALVEQFLWDIERYRGIESSGLMPREWSISGRMADALYRVLKDGKGEPA